MFKQVVPRLNFDHGPYAGTISLTELEVQNSNTNSQARAVSVVDVSQAYSNDKSSQYGRIKSERKPESNASRYLDAMSNNNSYVDVTSGDKQPKARSKTNLR